MFELARTAGLEGVSGTQIEYELEVACGGSSFGYSIDENANTYTVAAVLNALCLHCSLDCLFLLDDEATIVWGPREAMLRAHPDRRCGLYTPSEILPAGWFEDDADEDDENDELRDVYPSNAVSIADLAAITRGTCSVDEVVARAIAAGVTALEAFYPGRRFDGVTDDGCVLPVLVLRAASPAIARHEIDLATARELGPDSEIDDELAFPITRRSIPLLTRVFPELAFAKAFEIWNGATAAAFAAVYAPRFVP